jgi:diguanylate cyclase (GGDEF)-like protein
MLNVFGGDTSLLGYVISIIVPTIIASVVSYFYLNMYFELDRSRQEIHNLAIRDDLTQIFNRRHFFELARRELERSRRNGNSLSVILFDFDDFKKINDNYGHLVGDFVLKELCCACQNTIRPYDMIARFGGEEFIILLPDTAETSARALADRLCRFIAKQSVSYNGSTIQMTISVGLTSFRAQIDSLDDFLSRADDALYRAKRTGKNKVVVM